jgi:hypothetical protein
MNGLGRMRGRLVRLWFQSDESAGVGRYNPEDFPSPLPLLIVLMINNPDIMGDKTNGRSGWVGDPIPAGRLSQRQRTCGQERQ